MSPYGYILELEPLRAMSARRFAPRLHVACSKTEIFRSAFA